MSVLQHFCINGYLYLENFYPPEFFYPANFYCDYLILLSGKFLSMKFLCQKFLFATTSIFNELLFAEIRIDQTFLP